VPKRITPEDRQAVLDLHKAGRSRNDISRETGVSAGSVTTIIRDAGGSFERTATEAATKAKKADLAARRAALEEALIGDAERLRARIWQPRDYARPVGGIGLVEWSLSEPAAEDQLKLMQAAGAAVDRALKIDQHAQATSGADETRGLLGELFDQIKDQAGAAE